MPKKILNIIFYNIPKTPEQQSRLASYIIETTADKP